MASRRYVEYLMPVLVEVNTANKEVTRVIEFPEYIKPTGAVFGDDRTTLLKAESAEASDARALAEDNDNHPWPVSERDL